jgi:hypothetical protein
MRVAGEMSLLDVPSGWCGRLPHTKRLSASEWIMGRSLCPNSDKFVSSEKTEEIGRVLRENLTFPG